MVWTSDAKATGEAIWRPLFDGRSFEGWEHVGPGSFAIEDGAFHSDGDVVFFREVRVRPLK